MAALLTTFGLAPTAASAAAPAAPYDAFTIDGVQQSYLVGQGGAYDFSGSTVVGSAYGSNGVSLAASDQAGDWTADLLPPTGGAFTVGTSYNTAEVADATHAGFLLTGQARACDDQTGTLTIKELSTDSSNAVTAFAASYAISCDTTGVALAGELRWHSAVSYVATTADHDGLDYNIQDVGVKGSPKTVTFTGSGSAATVLGAASITGGAASAFAITADTCSHATLAYGATCTVTVTPHPSTTGALSATLVIPDNSSAAQRTVPLTANAVAGATGTFYPLTPTRLLDTRSGLGAPAKALGAGGVIHLQVDGNGGVPATGVSAVVLNVTVVSPTISSFLTVWPTGSTQPTASSVNFAANWTGANSVTVAVGRGGQVDIYNSRGTVQVLADVTGFYAADDTVVTSLGIGGQLQPTIPTRILDTRDPSFGGALPSGWSVIQPVDFGADVNPHIRALVVNITAVSPTGYGYLTAWNGLGAPPTTSVLNVSPGVVTPNMAVVPVGSCDIDPACAGLPSIGVYNGSGGSTHVLIDLVGFYDDSTLSDGLRYYPITPTRIADSRIAQGTPKALGAKATATIATPSTIGDDTTAALQLNVTAVNPTAGTFLTVWPTSLDQPAVSNLNPSKGQTVANAVLTLIGSDGAFNVYNSVGTVDILIDVAGYFDIQPDAAATKTPALKAPTLRDKPQPGAYKQ